MMCFRDMTFCHSNCTRTECPKHFGEDDKAAAQEWARRIGFDHGEVPVSTQDYSHDCKDYKAPENVEPR